MIVGCGSKSGRNKGLYFARVPSIVTSQGEETKHLSEERRSKWITAISRDDLTEAILENDRLCGKHFVSGRAAKPWDKYNIDWIPTLHLGLNKKQRSNLETATKRGERARNREQKRSLPFNTEHTSDEGLFTKRKMLNEPGTEILNIDFGTPEEDDSVQKDAATQTEDVKVSQAGTQTDEFEYNKPFDSHYFENKD